MQTQRVETAPLGGHFAGTRKKWAAYTEQMDIAATFLRRALVCCLATLLAPAVLAARPALPPLEGQVIVKFKADGDTVRVHALSARAGGAAVRSALAGRATALGVRVGRALEAGAAVGERTQVVKAAGITAQALAAQLAADPEVEFAEPNFKVRRATAPNDPYYLTGPAVNNVTRVGGPASGQWYLRAPTATVLSSVDIEAAWTRTTGSATVVVAVLDTGVRKEHPDLFGRLLAGYDFISDPLVANDGDGRDPDPSDPGDYTTAAENSASGGPFYKCDPGGTGRAVDTPSSWHGTSTTSLVGAATNDGIGMAGSAPRVKILPVRVLGKCFGNGADIIAAIRWAAGLHVDGVPDNPSPAKVINLSLGGGSCSTAYQQAVTDAINAGATIVAAAGNSDGGPLEAPASCTGVVGVVALRHIGTKVGFSSLGPEAVIAAPGGNCVNTTGTCLYPILAATNSGTTVPASSTWSDSFNTTVGTSFSSPLVAGIAGLLVSVEPRLTPVQVRGYLTSTARTFPTTGANMGVAQCQAPVANTPQDECYCNTTYCGAGMVDAGRAVAAVVRDFGAPPTARITTTATSVAAGDTLTLSGATSTEATGGGITAYSWSVAAAGAGVNAIPGSSTTTSITLTPSSGGEFTVALTVLDSQGKTNQEQRTFSVAGPIAPPASTGGGGGGGALSLPWLILLALAVGLLVRMPSRRA